jgi:aminopeptidase-like protein
MRADFARLYPLFRSITGAGLRRSLDIVGETIPLRRVEVPTGTRAFDWTVPEEWVVNEAYVIDPNGNRILDIADHNLHLLNYSASFRGTVSRAELDAHLYSRPDLPDAIPYAISYYERRWGFCIPHAQRQALPDGDYTVVIDTDHICGALSYGDSVLPGARPDEVLFSSYLCHPQMASHELAGPLILAALYERLRRRPDRRLTYRFFLGPETIGTVCYLSEMGDHLARHLKAGLIVTCAGDRAPMSYKQTVHGDAMLDRMMSVVGREFAEEEPALRIHPFDPMGSDERQYASPGFRLDVGAFGRSLFGSFPEYHSSLDDASVIDFNRMQLCIDFLETLCDFMEANAVYQRTQPFCEPQLGKHPGLYPSVGAIEQVQEKRKALMWVLSGADGVQDLLTVAERSGLRMSLLQEMASTCVDLGLIVPVDMAA